MKRLQGAFRKLTVLILSLFLYTASQAQDVKAGEEIFKNNCTSCHKLGSVLVGPDLTGVLSRWKDQSKLLAYVHNPEQIINSDPYAKSMASKFLPVLMPPQTLNDQQIKDVLAYADKGGSGAAAAAPGAGGGAENYAPIPSDNSFIRWIFYGIIVLIIIVLFLANKLVNKLNEVEGAGAEEEEGKGWTSKKVNSIVFPLFGILFFGFTIWEWMKDAQYIRPEAASEAGIQIDKLFNITLWVTGFVFIITQVLLFWYAFRYRGKKGKKGYYYPHNNTVEFVWTTIPAIVLAILVLYGFKTWNKVTSVPTGKDVQEVEAFAKQFSWTFRYPGPDGQLGKTDFRKIDPANNPLGIDFSDPASHDDIVSTDFQLPVNKTIYMRLRSQDVTHDAYLVHFRIQMYANPGLDNRMQFKPIYTTEEFRQKIGKPDFNFELACNQLCGSGHYNMRRVLVIEKQDQFDAWQKQQKPAFANYKATASK